MAHSLSAKKRIRENRKRYLRNRVRKERLKAAVRGFTDALSNGDSTEIEAQLRRAEAALDKAQTKGILHRRTVDRRKARLAKAAQRAASGAPTSSDEA